MSYEINGQIIQINDIQQVSDTFKKREFVIEQQEHIPNRPDPISNFIKFQMTQNRVELIDGFSEGQNVKVNFNIRGNKWQNREGQTTYFTNLEAWRITAEEAAPQAPDPAAPTQAQPSSQGNPDFDLPEVDDEMPF